MDKNTVCSVKNRSSSQVCYRIPEDGIRRTFAPGETKKIDYSELEKLSWQPGGNALMAQYLQILNETAIEDLGIIAEPEYHMNEEQVKELILSGKLDAFLDALDFAPEGVIDLIKLYAVSLPMTDYDKRKALKQKTGFDVDTALKHIEEERAEDAIVAETPQRRVQTTTENTPTYRRTSGSNYKKIDK